jgi:hypothetical protein
VGPVNTLIRLSMPRKSLSVSTFTEAELVAPRPCTVHTADATPGRAEAGAGAIAAAAAIATSSAIVLVAESLIWEP